MERNKISNELLDKMLEGVKTQDDLWGQNDVVTQLNKALIERMLNAEMDYHLDSETVMARRKFEVALGKLSHKLLYAKGMIVRDIQETLQRLRNGGIGRLKVFTLLFGWTEQSSKFTKIIK